MDHFLRVNIFQSLGNLVYDISSLRLFKPAIWLLIHFVKEFTMRCILQDQVNVLVVPKRTITLQNIFVLQTAAQHDLCSHLLLLGVLADLVFVQHF